MKNFFHDASPEFKLVAACCEWPASGSSSARLAQLSQASIDWSKFLRLVERHRVAGLAHAALREISVPAQVAQALTVASMRIAKQNLLSIGIESRLATHFERVSVPFLVMKGAPLAMLAYGTCTTRHSKDIDLLVRLEDVLRAEEVLAAEGFERTGLAGSLKPHQQSLWMRTRKHFEYVHQTSRTRVELHWRISDNSAVTSDDVMADREWVSIAPGVELPTLPRTELLLQLCAHGASHTWFRLKWLADVAALLKQETSQSVAVLYETARRRDFDRPLHQALLLCDALFEKPQALLPVKPSATVRWMTRVASKALLADDKDTSSSSQAAFVPRGQSATRFLLHRSWRYRWENLRVAAASPVDWQTLPLPRRLQFLYPALRLPLWISRKFSSSASVRP